MAGLTDFTFRDTGITVKIRKISPMLAADVKASIPEPQPPEQDVNYGEPRGIVREANKLSPDYLQAMVDHSHKIFLAWRRVMVLRSVDEMSLPAGWKMEVKEYRDFILAQTGKGVEEPEDLVVYVLRLCIGSEEDLNEFIQAVTRRSQPTQEVVDQAKASF